MLAPASLPAEDGGQVQKIEGRTMGTTFSVTWVANAATPEADALKGEVQQRLDDLEAAMSTYRATSDVSRFNRHAGDEWFAVASDTAAVVERAQQISKLTDGAFDITVYPLVCLWGFGPEPATGKPPTAAAIAQALRRVDYRKLEVRLSPPALRKNAPDLAIDLSGIAKGYASTEVARLVEARGIIDCLVAVGGEICVRGGRLPERTWRVGVERPSPNGVTIDRTLDLTDAAVSTSGDYRNFFDAAGARFSHLLDPRTGRPVPSALASVTVVDRDNSRADAFATALMVMGEDAGLAWARQQGVAGIFFSRSEGGIRSLPSQAFADRFDQVSAQP